MTGATDFWARRKARVAAEAEADVRARLDRDAAAQETAQAEKTDAELCEEFGLPDPDTLARGDDFSAFMNRAVPERLRRRALRRLWLSNPALANLDGMVDYGEDFTDSACVIEGMQTAYQVGKGMLSHVQEMARQAEAESAADKPPEPVEEPAPMALSEAETPPAEEPETAAEAPPAPREAVIATGDAPVQLPRRRMRFAFEDRSDMAGEPS